MEYVLDFKRLPGEDYTRATIRVSQHVADSIFSQLKNREKHIELHDERGNFVELLSKQEVKGIRKADDVTASEDMFAVCDYGTRHPHHGKEGFEECECKLRFGQPPIIFYRQIRQMFPNVDYDSDITEDMQKIYLQKLGPKV